MVVVVLMTLLVSIQAVRAEADGFNANGTCLDVDGLASPDAVANSVDLQVDDSSDNMNFVQTETKARRMQAVSTPCDAAECTQCASKMQHECASTYCGWTGTQCKAANATGTCAYLEDGSPRALADHEACCSTFSSTRDVEKNANSVCDKLGCFFPDIPASGACTAYGEIAFYTNDYGTERNSGGAQKLFPFIAPREAFGKSYRNGVPCLLFADHNCIHVDGVHPAMYLGAPTPYGATAGLYNLQVLLKCAKEQSQVYLNTEAHADLTSFILRLNAGGQNAQTHDALAGNIVAPLSMANQRTLDVLDLAIEAQEGGFAKFRLGVQHVTRLFEYCMNAKECVRLLDDPNADHLRQDNEKQLQCLDGSMVGDAVCNSWKQCTDKQKSTDLLITILKIALGLDNLASGSMLETGLSGCGAHDTATGCVQPILADAEAWDCDCHPAIMDQCGSGTNTLCIKQMICADSEVCQCWKNTHCIGPQFPHQLLSLADRASANLTGGLTMLTDSKDFSLPKTQPELTQGLKAGAASLAVAGREEKMDEALERKSNQC